MEMNIFAPQSIETQYELEEIADLKLQIITPQSSSPIIAMKQDQLLGAYNLTSEYYKLDWRTTMNLLASTQMESLDNVPKNKDYAGKEIFSYLIPKKINLMKGDPTKPTILVKNGIMESGILGDDSLGVKKSPSLVQLVWDEYGVEKTKTFLDNTTKLANNFNLFHGMTVGIKDLYISNELDNKMQQTFDTKKLEIQHEITEIENNPDMMDGDLFEMSVNQKLSVIRDDVSKVIMASMTKENNFRIMIESGSKGKPINITQMAGLVGQQDYHGGRILKNFNNRSLPYFFQNDDRAESRGFIERPFMHGLNISEFIFHHLSSREGLIDQTVRSVTPDTRITIIENSIPKTVEIGPWIDSIIKIKSDQVEHDVNEFELVNVTGITIPTVDSVGKVTWANVTAVTRHAKGNQLFEIVTRGGRKVKVPESKSLLIWNNETKQFEDKLTPDVKVGDFVPVTMNLPQPPIINNHIDMTEFKIQEEKDSLLPDKFILNKLNGQFIGLFLADGNVNYENGYIHLNNCNENVLNFIKKYFDGLDISYNENKKILEIETITDISGYSRILCKFLYATCGNDAYEKHVPDFAFNAPEEFVIGLIDGYISRNACVTESSITTLSCSLKLIDGINMLLNRIGVFSKISTHKYDNKNNDIKANYNIIEIGIRAQWVRKFKSKMISLINFNKNDKFYKIESSTITHTNYIEQEDVVLDQIVEINQLNPENYPKLYDLTVPGTFNFIISNGMGCRDTADSGYIQRKLIKSTEDFMVNYDGTVRNAVGRIQQFVYGESGADTVKQYEYKFQIMELSNSEIANKFKFTKEELTKVKNFTESDNNKFYQNILKCRDHLRFTQMKSTVEYKILNIKYMLPVNIYRIINNIRNDPDKKGNVNYDCEYILNLIDRILESKNTKLYCMTEEEMKDESSIKYKDDQMAKTALKYALLESLAPKKCIYTYKFTKEQLEDVATDIISSFNSSIVEPGEMVGIIAAQSLGEPVTQLMLNSLDWTEEILIHDSKSNQDTVLPIGQFIDNLIDNNKGQVTNPIDNLEAEMKNIYYLDTNDCNYQIKSVDENGKVSWKKIEAVTKHLPINKDGTNTLIRVTTRTGKSVIATKGKSFLTQKNNKIVPIRGDELEIKTCLPIMNKCLNLDGITYEYYKHNIHNIQEFGDVFMDEIISIEDIQPTNTYVYDFTVQDTKTFIISNGLCCMDSFHSSGGGGKGSKSIGVDRIKEVFSLSKNPKEPIMMIYLNKEHREKKDFANKIASHIKFTTIKDLRTKIEIYYDPKPYSKNGFMEKDNINTIFYTYQQSKQCCANTIDGLPWLMRIEFDREKLLSKEVSLLDIKSQFCFSWEKRYQDIKSVKREKRVILEKISQLAVLSNTDNDDIPTVHLRFDMTNFNSSTLIDFMDMFVDDFKLKGMSNIDDIRGGGKAIEERYISFDNPENSFEKKNEYVVYTNGINMYDIRNIIGIDLTRTYCNDIITTYEIFGIEAARNLIIREIINVLSSNGSGTNYQHIGMFGDLMTNQGTLTSIDRHGLNKLDTDPFSRASFEKTVDQLITAAVFNEVDHMKSVSSRIMAGLCIKGGTGLCDLILDKDLLENSEYTIDIGQLYNKTYQDITVQQKQQEIDIEVFIPDL